MKIHLLVTALLGLLVLSSQLFSGIPLLLIQGALALPLFLYLIILAREAAAAKKRVAQEKAEKDLIFELLEEGVIAIDQNQRLTAANCVASKTLGFSRVQDLINTPSLFKEKLTSPLLQKCDYLLQTSQKRGHRLTDSISLEGRRKTYFDLIAAPNRRFGGAVLILQNTSNHYKILEMGKDFVANASHELRTPITIIKGFAETLHDLPELPREMVVDIIEKIVRNCERMDKLVKNLLTLADLENLPESRFQRCDLSAIAENCRDLVSSRYPTAEIAIKREFEGSMAVKADFDILELAIVNLMDNAAKYSNLHPKITLILNKKGGKATIAVQDRGIGIPAEDLEHIFERFYTVDKARSRRLGGAGLGLSIVKTIAEKHHGTVSVSSDMGKGTTFTLSLPSYDA